MTTQDILELAALIERLEAGEQSRALDEACALALGWRTYKAGYLGLRGRSAGRTRWVGPNGTIGAGGDNHGQAPRLSGPRKRASTIAALKARAHTKGEE